MHDFFPVRDPNFQLLIQDYNSLADLTQQLIDGSRRPRHESIPAKEMEYTTEWQMERNAEMAHSL